MDLLTLAQINKLKACGGVGYSEYKTVELLSEQTAVEEMLASRCPNAGDEVTVYLNGVAYTQVAKYAAIEGMTGVYVGNGVEFAGEETDDAFGLSFLSFGGQIVAVFVPYGELADAESITISATSKIRTDYPIDKAYIPIWDIKLYTEDDVSYLTANGERVDLAKAQEIASSGIPAFLTYMQGLGATIFCPLSLLDTGDTVRIAYCSPVNGKGSVSYIDSSGNVSYVE